jgi:hypothetical protein
LHFLSKARKTSILKKLNHPRKRKRMIIKSLKRMIKIKKQIKMKMQMKAKTKAPVGEPKKQVLQPNPPRICFCLLAMET